MESEFDTLKTRYDAQIDTLKKWYDTLARDDSLWYDALDVEDSLKVYNALAADDSLIVGLAPSEVSLKVKNPLEDKRKCELLKKLWHADAQARVKLTLERTLEGAKGRTALHVAARRGNVKLVKRILEMAENGTHGAPGEDQGTPSSSTDLNLLLRAKDSDYDLDALAMAVVNGNKEIVNLLTAASRRCESNPYDISCNAEDDDSDLKEDQGDKGSAPAQQSPATTLQLITKRIFYESDVTSQRKILKLYSEDCDFNFLYIWEYLFHFTFSTWSEVEDGNKDLISPLRENLFNSLVKESVERKGLSPGQTSCQTSVWKYLLVTMRDGQGRTPLHVAVDSTKVPIFLDYIPPEKGTPDKNEDLENYPDYVYLNARDSADRTPLYRAAAKGNSVAVKRLLKDKRTDVSAEVKYSAHQWGADLDLDKLSWRNGFQCDDVYLGKKKLRRKGLTGIIHPCVKISSTVLHVAIIHRREEIVDDLLKVDDPEVDDPEHSPLRAFTAGVSGSYQSDAECTRRFTWPVVTDAEAGKYEERSVNAMQLTVLVGNIPILQKLLKEDVQKKKRKYHSAASEPHSFLLAAAMGCPDTIKAFLDNGQDPLDPIGERGDTALHYALRGQHVKFQPHLVDFVGCEHVRLWRMEDTKWVSRWLAGPEVTSQAGNDADKEEKSGIEKRYGQRRGSVKLLLQAGMNTWKRNDDQRTARPEPDAPEEFVTWWYDQVADETKQAQEKLNAAANAISIIAALVATASYIGPYTPPLGYSDSSVQVNILPVRIFVVCNSLSFYAALVAIIYAVLPSLPLPEESVFEELKRTRLLVAVSLAFLLVSIVCVLVAFAASYVAVTPDNGLSHHSLAISTIIVGGFFCLTAISRFLERWINVLLTLPKDVTYEFKNYEIFVNFSEIKSIFKNLKMISKSWYWKKIGRS